jgi:hypothetical protein
VKSSKYVEPISSVRDVTPATLRLAYRYAADGTLAYAAEICERLFSDERIISLLETLSGVFALPMEFEGDDAVVEALSGRRGDWWMMFPEDVLSDLTKWTRVLGVAIAQVKEWRTDETTGRAVPMLKVWNPKHLRWDRNELKWYLRTRTGEIEIKPGEGEWVIMKGYSSRDPWLASPWHGLSLWWLAKSYSLLDWSDQNDRLATGKFVAEPGKEVSFTPEQRKELARDIQQLGRNGSVVMPEGVSLKLLESQADTYETYSMQIDAANTAFAVALLGNNLSSEVKGGSYAAASVHENVADDKKRSLSETFATQLRDSVLKFYVKANFGDGVAVPWPSWNLDRPKDKNARATELASLGGFLDSCAKASVSPNLEQLSEEFELELVAGTPPTPASGAQEPTREVFSDEVRETTDGEAEGQRLADELVENSVSSVDDELPIDAMLEAISSAKTYGELRAALLRIAGTDMDPNSFANVMARADTIAQLLGEYTAKLDGKE